MKNRFYYSKFQSEADTLIARTNYIAGIDYRTCKPCYIKLDNGKYVEYTEWCNTEDNPNCNDAILVYETDSDKEALSRIKCSDDLDKSLILSIEEFEHNNIIPKPKSLIEPCMIVEMRNGELYFVVSTKRGMYIILFNVMGKLDEYSQNVKLDLFFDENLNSTERDIYDIVKIYGHSEYACNSATTESLVDREIIRKRGE